MSISTEASKKSSSQTRELMNAQQIDRGSDSDSSSSSSNSDEEYDDAGVGPDTEYLGVEHVLFSKAFSVQFHVDSAIGLPVSSTATRVSAILITANRKQIGDATLSSFSQPASNYASPKYDLHMSWRKSELVPTVTILCRVDTLENPSLMPRCIGYAACKLCIDENGLQVNESILSQSNDNLGFAVSNFSSNSAMNVDTISNSSHGTSDANHHIYVNSGHFLLPVVYGSINEISNLTVAAIEAMPHISGAFLSVKLKADCNSLDSVSRYMRASSETGTADTEEALASVSSTNYHSQYSILNPLCVTKILVDTYATRTNLSLPKLPMSSALLSDVLNNQKIYSGEKMMMHTYMKEWIRSSFPSNVASVTQFINHRTMFTYSDDVGALVALDMLHNMPARTNLIRAASDSAAVQAMNTGLSKGWDGKITFFKTVFKYLPGDPIKAANEKNSKTEQVPPETTKATEAPIMSMLSTSAPMNLPSEELKIDSKSEVNETDTAKDSPHPEDNTNDNTTKSAVISKQIALSFVSKVLNSALVNASVMTVTPMTQLGTAVSILSRHSSSSSDVSSTADLTTPLPNIVVSPPKSLANKPQTVLQQTSTQPLAVTTSGISSRRSSRGSNLAVVLENVPIITNNVNSNTIRRRSLRNGELPGDLIVSTNEIAQAVSGAGVSSSKINLRRRSIDNNPTQALRRRSLTNNVVTTAITVSGGLNPSNVSGRDTLKPLPSDLNGSSILRRRSIGGAAIVPNFVQDSPKPKSKSFLPDPNETIVSAVARRRSVGSAISSGYAIADSPVKPKPTAASAWSDTTSGSALSSVVSTLRRRSIGGGSSSVGIAPPEVPVTLSSVPAPIDLLSPSPSGRKALDIPSDNSYGNVGAIENEVNSSNTAGNYRRRSLNNIRRRSLNNNLNFNNQANNYDNNSSQYKYLSSPTPMEMTKKTSMAWCAEETIIENSNSGSSEDDSIKKPSRLMSPITRPMSKSEQINSAIDSFATNIRRNSFGKDSIQAGIIRDSVNEDEDDIYDFGGTSYAPPTPQISLSLTSDNVKRNSLIEQSLSSSAKLQATLNTFNQNIRRNSNGGLPPGVTLTKMKSNNDLVSDKTSNHSKTSRNSRKYIYSRGRTEIRNNSIFDINNEFDHESGVGSAGLGGNRRGSHSSLNSYVSELSALPQQQGVKASIIDDASLDLDLETSTEQFPVYLDEYSNTAGLGITKCGALLIVVTAVDILTANGTTNISVPNSQGTEEPKYLINAHHVPFSPQHSFSSLLSDYSFLYRNAKHIKAEKLQGLVGIFIGHCDPNSTWWGLLPLQIDSPFHSVVMSLSGENTPVAQAPPPAVLGNGPSDSEITVTALGVVNSGTHQVPLFSGVPPKEMIDSADPMEWVVQKLESQNKMRREMEKLKSSSVVGDICGSLHSMFANSPKSKKSKKVKLKDELKLSNGASAIVRVVDARLLRFGCDPIAINPSKHINTSHLESIIEAFSLSSKEIQSSSKSSSNSRSIKLLSISKRPTKHASKRLIKKFQYSASRIHNSGRRIKDSIPMLTDPETLMSEVNQKFTLTLSDD